MELLSNSQFDIRHYYGNLVVIYPEGGEETARAVFDALDGLGYVYHSRKIGASLLIKGSDIQELSALLDSCACLIPIFDQSVSAKKDPLSFGLFWYLIGLVRARLKHSPNAIIPYIPDRSVSLKETPIQGLNIVRTAEELLHSISSTISTKLLRHQYYADRTINLYASQRIRFQCLRIKFKIYEKAFQSAMRLYSLSKDRDITDEAFDSYIECYLSCGCRIISFGTETRLEPQMMVYKDEIHPIDSGHAVSSKMGKRSYRRLTDEECRESGVRAEMTVDVLVPVHKILGAYIKCYLTVADDEMPIQMLLSLLEPDFTDGKVSEYDYKSFMELSHWTKAYPSDVHIEGRNLYFTLERDNEETALAAAPELGVGEYLDYIFPQ